MTYSETQDIYTQALSSLSEKDRCAVLEYEEKMTVASRVKLLTPEEQTKLVTTTLNDVPGGKEAMGKYDIEVGKLLRQRG